MYHVGHGCQPEILGTSGDAEGGCGGGWGVAGDGVERVQSAGPALAGAKGAGARDGAAARVFRPGRDGAGLEAPAGGRGRGALRGPSLLRLRRPGGGAVLTGGFRCYRGGGVGALVALRGAGGGAGPGGYLGGGG